MWGGRGGGRPRARRRRKNNWFRGPVDSLSMIDDRRLWGGSGVGWSRAEGAAVLRDWVCCTSFAVPADMCVLHRAREARGVLGGRGKG